MENAAPHEILTGRFRTLGHHKLEAIQPLHRELRNTFDLDILGLLVAFYVLRLYG